MLAEIRELFKLSRVAYHKTVFTVSCFKTYFANYTCISLHGSDKKVNTAKYIILSTLTHYIKKS